MVHPLNVSLILPPAVILPPDPHCPAVIQILPLTDPPPTLTARMAQLKCPLATPDDFTDI